MLGKETGQNKPVPLGKNWHVNFSCYTELQVFLLFSVDAKVEAQHKKNLSVHKKIDYYR